MPLRPTWKESQASIFLLKSLSLQTFPNLFDPIAKIGKKEQEVILQSLQTTGSQPLQTALRIFLFHASGNLTAESAQLSQSHIVN